jgi:hypothetical protein
MNTRSIGWPNGRLSVDQRNRAGWVFWIWKYKIDASLLANGSLIINTNGAWQQLLRNKYLGGKSITQVSRKARNS